MPIMHFIQRMARLAFWHFERGLSMEGVLTKLAERFPGMTAARRAAASAIGQRAYEVSRRVRLLAPHEQLQHALRGAKPPSATVSVQVVVDFKASPRHKTSYYASAVVEVPWNATTAEILAQGLRDLADVLARYPAHTIIKVETRGPIYFHEPARPGGA